MSRGLANAFQAITETDYINEVSESFSHVGRTGFAWNDSTIGVEWPITNPILSKADRDLPPLQLA